MGTDSVQAYSCEYGFRVVCLGSVFVFCLLLAELPWENDYFK